MKRRQILLAGGGLVASSGTIIGSSAISSVNADRTVSVNVENDDDAYLRLRAKDTNFAYTNDDGVLEFRFDDDFNESGDFGRGVGTDSVYEFGSVFTVENQGTQDVAVFGTYNEDDVADIDLFESAPNPDSKPLTEDNRSTELEPGDILEVGMVVDTTNVEIGEYETTILIRAASDKSEVFN